MTKKHLPFPLSRPAHRRSNIIANNCDIIRFNYLIATSTCSSLLIDILNEKEMKKLIKMMKNMLICQAISEISALEFSRY